MRLDRIKRLSRALGFPAFSSGVPNSRMLGVNLAPSAESSGHLECAADSAPVAVAGRRGWTVTLAQAETLAAEAWTVGRELSDGQLDRVNGGYGSYDES